MKRDAKSLMIVGAGKLGGPVLDLLAARYPDFRYILVRRDAEQSERRLNLTRYMCAQWGSHPDLRWDTTDLLDIDRTASLLARYRPDVVLNATTPFPWWLIDSLPPSERNAAHSAGPGAWCALDCLLPLQLGQALAATGDPVLFVNACYPDAVNPFLSGTARPPLLGIGNLGNLVPGLQLTFAHHLRQDLEEIDVRLVCHHFTSLNGPSSGASGAPYQLTVRHGKGETRFDGADDTPFELLASTVPRIRGLGGQGVTVGSAATVVASLLKGERRRHHVPGPLGLPGGYPVEVTASGSVTLDLPQDTTVHDAVTINVSAQRFDGVEDVGPGTIRATDPARDAFTQIIGCELPTVTPDNILPIAHETIERLNAKYRLGLMVP